VADLLTTVPLNLIVSKLLAKVRFDLPLQRIIHVSYPEKIVLDATTISG